MARASSHRLVRRISTHPPLEREAWPGSLSLSPSAAMLSGRSQDAARMPSGCSARANGDVGSRITVIRDTKTQQRRHKSSGKRQRQRQWQRFFINKCLSYVEKHFGREDFRFRCDSVNIWPADSAFNGRDDGLGASQLSTFHTTAGHMYSLS